MRSPAKTTSSSSTSYDEDEKNNRDYEGDHMRLIKHGRSSEQEKSDRHAREIMNKLNESIINLDNDIRILTTEIKELQETIKNLSSKTLKK
jgi:hypothetical protein